MSLRRTPPPAAPAAPQPYYDSDAPLERSDNTNVSVRHKRRRELDDDYKELKAEMSGLISSLSTAVETHFSELKKQNAELKDSLKFMSDKYDNILKSLENLEEERANDKKLIIKLEDKIEALERKTRSATLEIRNVPTVLKGDKTPESKEDIIDAVKCMAKTLELELQDCEIKDIYRITTNKENLKPIIVELNSVLKKEKIIQKVKSFNKKKTTENKLNSGHLGITGPVRPVYISETLTFKAQKLFYLARQFAKDQGYSYCWTSRGQVFLRKVEGERPVRIDNESDFSKQKK